MEDAHADTSGAKIDTSGHVVSNGVAAISDGLASIKSIGDSKAVRRVRQFLGRQAAEAPMRTTAIVVGAGLAAGFLAGRAGRKKWSFL
jgi:hypothetical protein